MLTRERPAQGGEDRAIGGSELGSGDLAAQHADLLSEHGDLDVFGVLVAEASQQDAKEPACDEVKEAEGHRPIVSPGLSLLEAPQPRF